MFQENYGLKKNIYIYYKKNLQILLIQSKQDLEHLPALSLDCRCGSQSILQVERLSQNVWPWGPVKSGEETDQPLKKDKEGVSKPAP